MTTAATRLGKEGVSTSADEPLVELIDVSRVFGSPGLGPLQRSTRQVAVDTVSLQIRARSSVSIVGESGSGKTTTARMILGIDAPTSGTVRFRGTELGRLRRAGRREFRRSVQAVFQDATSSLNPRRKIGKIVGEPLVVNSRLRGTALDERVAALLADVGLSPDVAGSYPGQLSGGMRQRVAIAQALALHPALIVMDEPISALDVSIRAQILNLLKELQAKHDLAYVVISHDLASVRYLSDVVITMYGGRIVESAPSEQYFTRAAHPYSLALLAASDVFGESDPVAIPQVALTAEASVDQRGCSLAGRCWLRRHLGDPQQCTASVPLLRSIAADHQAACHFAEELTGSRRAAIVAETASEQETSGAAQ